MASTRINLYLTLIISKPSYTGSVMRDIDRITFIATAARYWERNLDFGNCAGATTFIVDQYDQNYST